MKAIEGLVWWHNDLEIMFLCFAFCPYILCEFSVVNLIALSRPCEYAAKFGNTNIVPFIWTSCNSLSEKPSASTCSQTPFCERLIKFDKCVDSVLMNVIFLMTSLMACSFWNNILIQIFFFNRWHREHKFFFEVWISFHHHGCYQNFLLHNGRHFCLLKLFSQFKYFIHISNDCWIEMTIVIYSLLNI